MHFSNPCDELYIMGGYLLSMLKKLTNSKKWKGTSKLNLPFLYIITHDSKFNGAASYLLSKISSKYISNILETSYKHGESEYRDGVQKIYSFEDIVSLLSSLG